MNSNLENKGDDKLGKIAHFSDSYSQQGPSSCSKTFFFKTPMINDHFTYHYRIFSKKCF